MNIKFFLSIFLFLSMSTQINATNRGDKLMNAFNFLEAKDYFIKKYESENDNMQYVERIATCYRLMNDYTSAESWYIKCVTNNINRKQNLFYLGQAYRINKKYSFAQETFALLASDFDDTVAKNMAISLNDVIKKSYPNNKQVTLMPFNSEQSDFAPTYRDNHLYFATNRMRASDPIRTDNWTIHDFLQLYKVGDAKNPAGVSSKAENFNEGKDVNAKYHEGPIAFHPITNDLYFSRSNYIKNKATKSTDEAVKLKIYRVAYNATTQKWDGPIESPLSFNNDQYSVAHPTFSKDGKMIYFTSDMPGGLGGSDIWMAPISDNKNVGMPENMGPIINTPHNELFPLMRADSILVYSTDGMYGYGGQDFYYTYTKKDGSWKKPINIGMPLNSNMDDFGMTLTNDSTIGYITSNREKGKGDDDIYSFYFQPDLKKDREIEPEKPKEKEPEIAVNTPVEPVQVVPNPNKPVEVVNNDKTNPPVENVPVVTIVKKEVEIPTPKEDKPAIINPRGISMLDIFVKVVDKKTGEPIPDAKVLMCDGKNFTTKDGLTNWHMLNGSDCYLKVSKSRYLPVDNNVKLAAIKGTNKVEILVEMEFLEIGREIVIKNILYDLDKYFIRPDAAGELKKVYDLMVEYPNMIIQMGSHTDCRMPVEYNMTLSENRAKAAKEYLTTRGIKHWRMTYKGYGETKLTNNCPCESDQKVADIGLQKFRRIENAQCAECTEEMHQANRRTTFKIISF